MSGRSLSSELLHMIVADVMEVLRAVIKELAPDPGMMERLQPDQDIRLAGIDAAGLHELARRIERCYAISLGDQALSMEQHTTLASISRYILRRTALFRSQEEWAEGSYART